jgi:RES domain-containing protein
VLEVAVHKGFRVLDTVRHVITQIEILEPGVIRFVQPDEIPNPNWLRPGPPSAGQQEFGDSMLAGHVFVALPSAVSSCSWNLVFDPGAARGCYRISSQEIFALDTRLYPSGPGE